MTTIIRKPLKPVGDLIDLTVKKMGVHQLNMKKSDNYPSASFLVERLGLRSPISLRSKQAMQDYQRW